MASEVSPIFDRVNIPACVTKFRLYYDLEDIVFIAILFDVIVVLGVVGCFSQKVM
jgi:hypothetical protein